jgi:dipeptidase E
LRLFLASAELTAPSVLLDELARLAGPVTRIAVVLNPRDDDPALVRPEAFARERDSLASLAAETAELDLREYDGRPDALRSVLDEVGLIWITGGNMVTLGPLLARSGLDRLLASRLAEDSIVYAGYSAGACVAGPPLSGAELTGRAGDGGEPWWGWLGLIDFSIVPHHPDPGEAANEFVGIAEQMRVRGLPCRTLRNGEAIVVADGSVRLVGDGPPGALPE